MQKININLETLSQTNQKSLPDYAKKMIDDVKEFLYSDEMKTCIKASGLEGLVSNVLFQGSYKDDTANDYFRIIPKSDIDMIAVIGEYEQSFPTIIINPEGNKNIRDWTSPLNPSLQTKYSIDSVSGDTSETYREIYLFKNLRDKVFARLRNIFRNSYAVEMGDKVIKVSLKNSDNTYVVELALAGKLSLNFAKDNALFSKWQINKLKDKKLIEVQNNDYVLKGFNIVTSKMVPYRNNYYYELPNFSGFNKFFLSQKNVATLGRFSRYVILFKNFIKIWNAKNEMNHPINLSSFHIESFLSMMDDSYFQGSIDHDSVKKILDNLPIPKTQGHFDQMLEINQIFKMNRNLTFENAYYSLKNLQSAMNFEYYE